MGRVAPQPALFAGNIIYLLELDYKVGFSFTYFLLHMNPYVALTVRI